MIIVLFILSQHCSFMKTFYRYDPEQERRVPVVFQLAITAMFTAELDSDAISLCDPCSWAWTGWDESIVGKGKG